MTPTLKTALNLGCAAAALVATLLLLTPAADARAGGGRSLGSRGERTYTAPPTTNTAPKTTAPVERSMTQPGKSTTAQSAQTGAAAKSSRFGGLGSLLMGGLIGAALASMFGLGGLASVLGFILQMALIAAVVWLVMSFLRNRRAAPALATAGTGRSQRTDAGAAYRQAAFAAGGAGVTIDKGDYDAFERLLGDVQAAFGRGDMKALEPITTPEMLSYFAEELANNRKAGVHNELSQPKLLQGDLSEAWREASGDYATVAMRYSILDETVDRSSGRVVAGSKAVPSEVTEVWTFRRPVNGNPSQWELSAIQQAA